MRLADVETATRAELRALGAARLRELLARALVDEHPCTDNTCDIAVACEEDLHLWAAHILTGATECPLTTALYAALAPTDADLEAERLQLLTVPHIECDGCGDIGWSVEPGDTCANCRDTFPDRYDVPGDGVDRTRFYAVVCGAAGRNVPCVRRSRHAGNHLGPRGETWPNPEDSE